MAILRRIFGRREVSLPERDLDELKKLTAILFVDDDKFSVVDILKTHGWVNTELVSDIENLDEARVRNSNLIFVDIHGVGASLGFQDEGLGLVGVLKRKYPEKRVIVYSAESKGDRFNENLARADARMRKNADPVEFLTLVEEYSRELFSAPECIERLRTVLRDEFHVNKSYEDVEAAVKEIAKKPNFSDQTVARVFNIERAGSIASILGLLFST